MPVYPRGVSSSGIAHLGEQRAAEQLDALGLPHVFDTEQDVLGAGVAELAEPVDDAVRRLAAARPVLRHVEVALERRALDLVEGPPDGLAMCPKHLPLAVNMLR